MIRTDNGPQFISHAFQTGVDTIKIEHERIPPKTPNMNAHIEAFHRILEDECLSRFQFETYEDAYREVSKFMKFYNERRMHSSILDLSPQEFYKKQRNEKLEIKEIRL
ncbi:putative transposase [Evansella caseinilytica]|uniref:Putative transposase n=1 Tax=Evansella caseinilytica TaxID=1503961 RepID=A0A1H3G5Q7_9BACI|nr:putative transposase [Evansella caseinilytica]